MGPNDKTQSDDRSVHRVNTRHSLRLFAGYSLFYLAFVLVNAFAPQWAEWRPSGGSNLAIWWGFALIGSAILVAFIYGLVGRRDDRRSDELTERPSEGDNRP